MTPKEAEEKYGKEMLKRIRKTGYLTGITISMNKDGTIDVPESDYDRAYRAAKGEKINPMEWD